MVRSTNRFKTIPIHDHSTRLRDSFSAAIPPTLLLFYCGWEAIPNLGYLNTLAPPTKQVKIVLVRGSVDQVAQNVIVPMMGIPII